MRPLKKALSLEDIKKSAGLKDMVLARNSRLSVQPVLQEEWKECLRLAGM